MLIIAAFFYLKTIHASRNGNLLSRGSGCIIGSQCNAVNKLKFHS